MNTDFWHRQWIRALQALLVVLCAGFFSFSMAANHTHGDEQPGTVLSVSPIAPGSTTIVIPPNHRQHVVPKASQETASAMSGKDHRGHGAHSDPQSSEPCPMPCDGTLPCPSVCALACATGGVSATAIPTNVALPRDWGLTRVPTHDDVDAIVEVTLPPLYRPPIS